MIRSFIALSLPEEITDTVLDLQENLPGANWISDENLHLTLAFLGEQPKPVLEDLDSALRQLQKPCFELTLSGVGHFGPTAQQVFAGIAPCPTLHNLQDVVATMVRRTDIPLPKRKFIPHVTLARWPRHAVSSEHLKSYIAMHNLFRSQAFKVQSVTLFRSSLSRHGAVYDPLAVYPLID